MAAHTAQLPAHSRWLLTASSPFPLPSTPVPCVTAGWALDTCAPALRPAHLPACLGWHAGVHRARAGAADAGNGPLHVQRGAVLLLLGRSTELASQQTPAALGPRCGRSSAPALLLQDHAELALQPAPPNDRGCLHVLSQPAEPRPIPRAWPGAVASRASLFTLPGLFRRPALLDLLGVCLLLDHH